ncbi:MAG TPA: aryl-sulfate sulfotransferase [Bacteroidia bacterium]|nr:aryl-sulfate sulfotransferase [Bacteroidia bacterium]
MQKSTFACLFFLFLCAHTLLSQQRSLGLIRQNEQSLPGYVLFAPLNSKYTFLIDKCGKEIRRWQSQYTPGQSAYLLKDGSLLRCGNDSNKTFQSGGGRIERFDWNGKLKWSYVVSDSMQCQHHDIYPMPDGNILVLVWERIPQSEAIRSGRDPKRTGAWTWSEKIMELRPKGKDKADVIWEWRTWDHLVQDFDPTKLNYGTVSENPQLINLNFLATSDYDWLHFNSLAYNAELDQIVVSNRNFSEIFIIDHSTNTAEARSHKKGRQKHGGDLLYRWGNPMAYNCGTEKDQKLFRQHTAVWIEKGLTDAGKLLLFNNGFGRPDSLYSSVEIIAPPLDAGGAYKKTPGQRFEPEQASWMYTNEIKTAFFSKNVSSAQRLSNGNTLICSGASGRFFEIDPGKNIVWYYVNPVSTSVLQQGQAPVQNQVFRCWYYGPEYGAFKKKRLEPGSSLEGGEQFYPCIMDSPIPAEPRK